jgi:hypothetical protein
MDTATLQAGLYRESPARDQLPGALIVVAKVSESSLRIGEDDNPVE